ncbi:MAG: hypothetical protein JNL21_24085, partial [Myxococcales bacterium]|nr:hypothetical protein [Myxococcales bacterium]
MTTNVDLSAWGLALLSVLGCGGVSASGTAAGSLDKTAPAAGSAPIGPSANECGPRAAAPPLRALAGRSGGSITLAEVAGRRLAYVADEENGVVRTIDTAALAELAVTEVGGKPAQVLPLPGGRLAVTLRDKNQLVIFEVAAAPEDALVHRCSRATYAEPFGLAVAADGATLALTSGWDHRLTFLDASSLEISRTVDVAAEPRGVLLSDDGKSAYVSHLVGGVVTIVPLEPKGQAKAVFVRPPRREVGKSQKKKTRADEELERPKAQALAAGQGYAIVEASLGKTKDTPWPARVFVPMASSDPMRFGAVSSFPGVYGGGGGVAVIGAFVAVLDPVAGGPLGGEVAPLRQARPEDCILPRSAAVSGMHLYVTCLGTNRVVELDLRSADPITAESRRFETGEGPTGIVVDEAAQRALVFSQFSLELTVIDLSADPSGPRVQALPLARPETPALDEQAALGRTLFHATRDVRLSFDGRACASCHPEGRADSLTWSTPDG